MSKPSHIPVLAKEALEFLAPQPDDILVDATVGLGGHARILAEKLGPNGRLIGIDQDEQTLQIANDNLKSFNDRVVLVHGNFRHLRELVENAGYRRVDGILFDLGFSSFQIDEPTRGFSFLHDAPLDMRMDTTSGGTTAAELVNRASYNELVRILAEYGEEPKAEAITKRILEARRRAPIATTMDLVRVVGGHQGKIHPATRVFQALRIAVNDELQALREALPQAIELLKPQGRLVVITFHSLEDRIVKNFFKNEATGGRTRPLTKKALPPSWEERRSNSRSRSAKLRAVERLATRE
ncbi:MAG: 16S rRNA (cytosine(1402)-N(4))-methyltransferase RsmH [Patescibacteria group bacterium]